MKPTLHKSFVFVNSENLARIGMLWVSNCMEAPEEGEALVGLSVSLIHYADIVGQVVAVKPRDETELKTWPSLGNFGYRIELTEESRSNYGDGEWWFRDEFKILSPLIQLANAAQEDEK